MNQPARNFRPSPSDRLDFAIEELEKHNDAYQEIVLQAEEAEAAYNLAYYRKLAKATGNNAEARKGEAIEHCESLGLDKQLRATRAVLEAAKERGRNIRAIMEALRTMNSNARVGI